MSLKKLALIRKALIAALVVAVGLAGFAVGRVSAPQFTPAPQVERTTPAPVEAAGRPEGAPETATPVPAPSAASPTPAATEKARPAANAYVLKREGNGLVVLKNEVVVAAFSAEWSQLPEQVKTQLETGILFESLDDIESYLEDYES